MLDRRRAPAQVQAMRMIDIPPVWLLAALALTWAQARYLPVPGWPEGGLLGAIGTGLVALGLGLILLAVFELMRSRTTPIPHLEPSALVTSGVFRVSRNPIYLGDALILLGLALRWEAPLALGLVPLFVLLIERRFILAEEARLRRAFGAAYDDYAGRVRRWL